MSVRISVRNRGPFVVDGQCTLVCADGTLVEHDGKKRLLLCRCGGSSNRPFCDGAHFRAEFDRPDET